MADKEKKKDKVPTGNTGTRVRAGVTHKKDSGRTIQKPAKKKKK